MASFAPLHTGQFIIKPRALPRRRTLLLALLLLIVLIPYLCFEVGRMRAGYSVVSSQREHFAQAADINRLQTEVTGLRRELGSAQLGRKVDQQSSDSMQQSLAGLHATIQKQQEELAFYKAIVAPSAGAPKEPQVQRLEIEPDAVARRYLLRLVLIQSMQATGNAQGNLQVQVTGTRQGQTVTMPLSELMVGEHLSALPFAYRYFQTVEQLLELPADFQPQTVQVELYQGQHVVQRQDFVWQPGPI